AEQQEVPEGLVAVRAPSVGTFYRAASPGAKPFVEVGSHVGAEDIVCVFDVMKLFSSLKAGVAGTVNRILVENQALVQQDEPLILIAPD
ncbi:MAG TPA: biotin/lipoyl-containing protein, partial [Burkholderiales bacterium]|nr:biotin/lipoyl-containing protein [Burkholderiales bacterium]